MMNKDELYILEENGPESGYQDRFESIKKLILIKGEVMLSLNGEEAEKLFKYLKPPLYG